MCAVVRSAVVPIPFKAIGCGRTVAPISSADLMRKLSNLLSDALGFILVNVSASTMVPKATRLRQVWKHMATPLGVGDRDKHGFSLLMWVGPAFYAISRAKGEAPRHRAALTSNELQVARGRVDFAAGKRRSGFGIAILFRTLHDH